MEAKGQDGVTEMEMMDHLLSGSLDNLPQKESSVVRIFLSSTFTDMQAERNWLMKYAIPHLRSFCLQKGLEFQIADMRWGVREDAMDDHKTTQLCLEEIKNCQKVSRGPNFVTFLGDKYGYRPFPAQIEASEFKLLKNTAQKLGHDTSLLLSWFLCDYNQEPATYVLQPITSQFPYFLDMTPTNVVLRQQAQREWWSVFDKMTQMLRDSADHLYNEGKFTKDQRQQYFQSVTEHEVSVGILTADDIKDKVVCFKRSFMDINLKDKVTGRFLDVVEGGMDMEAEELRERLRLVKLPAVLSPGMMHSYTLPWDSLGLNIYRNNEHISYIQQFGKDFISSIEKMINASINKSLSSKFHTPLFYEVLHHLRFCQQRCDIFCGREPLLEEIRDKLVMVYVLEEENTTSGQEISEEIDKNNGDSEAMLKAQHTQVAEEQKGIADGLKSLGVIFTMGDDLNDTDADPNNSIKDQLTELPKIRDYTRPVIMYGASGSGKTAIMAKVMQLSKTWFPNSVGMIRFLGTSTMSTTVREVIFSLCQQIRHVYNMPRVTALDMEGDYQFLIDYFMALLWKINTSVRPLVMILDSVDQLSPADHAHTFNWVPHKLPPGVHLLISLVSDRLNVLQNVRQVFQQEDLYIEIPQLENETAVQMINTLCSKASRHLSKGQRNILLDKFAVCCQPLYLKVLTDMSLSWRSYTEVDRVALGQTIREAIFYLFNTLERNHGDVLVKKGIGYMCAAREGLTDIEIDDLLSLDDEVLQDSYIYHLPPDEEFIRLPPLLWKRVQYDISEYVVERQSGSKTVVTWYHRQFWEATRERYLQDSVRPGIHKVMAEYFQGTWCDKPKPLVLSKGKKGSFPKAYRQVPAQPIQFSQSVYNTRKLSELPYHLVQSREILSLLTDYFCDPEWLYAKCHTMSLTALMEDFKMAEQTLSDSIAEMSERLKGMETPDEKLVTSLKQEQEILTDVRLVMRMVLLSSDVIRKDPVYLPIQILCSLGPDFKGSVHIEKLVTRCQTWCRNSQHPLLLPVRKCMLKPDGDLLYTIDADVCLVGDGRDSGYQPMFYREGNQQLFAVRQRSAKSDVMCVYDMNDNGSCIISEDINRYIHSIQFVGNKKYLLLEVYLSKDKFHPTFESRLYESSTASPVSLPHPAKLVAVSTSGTYIAYSNASLVNIVLGEKCQKVYYHIMLHEKTVTSLLISPDESFLVTTDRVTDKFSFGNKDCVCTYVFNIKEKKCLYAIHKSLAIKSDCLITNDNLLLCKKEGYKGQGTVVIFDLCQGQVLQEVKISESYCVDMQLHSSHLYVVVDYKGSGTVWPGHNEKVVEVVDIRKGHQYGRCPIEGHYTAASVFGQDSIYYAVGKWNVNHVTLLYAGPTHSPLKDAVVIHHLIGHNQPIIQILTTPGLDLMMTASMDNTVKVWQLKPILEGFVHELSQIEHQMGPDVEFPAVVARFSSPDIGDIVKTTKLAFNKQGDSLYVGTDSGQMRLYDVESGQQKLTFDLDIGPITLMVLSRSGRYMIAAGDRKIHIEDLHSQEPRQLEHKSSISCLVEANNVLVAGTRGMEAHGRAWNIQTGELLKEFGLLYSFYCAALNSTGTMLLSSMFDFPVIMNLFNDTEGGLDMNANDTMMTSATCCGISPDDTLGATGSSDGALRVIKVTGSYKYRLQQRSSVVAMAFTPDSQQILSAGYRSIYVWSMEDGSLRYKLTRHLDFVNGMKFDETGRFLVTISLDKQLVLWDMRRAVSIATFHTQCQVHSMEMSSGAQTIAYIPQGVADLAILTPNAALSQVKEGKYKGLGLKPQVGAVALAFSSQRMGSSTASSTCNLM